jgi:dihydrodipicolinate synthase/N-acetylneuraminate lyase
MTRDTLRGMDDRSSIGTMCITPFGPDGSVDGDLLRTHLDHLGHFDLSIYLCSQGSGEGLSLAPEEKEEVYRIGAEVLGGRREVVGAGIGLAGDTDSTIELVKRLSATGVDAIQVFPPRTGALRPRDREIIRYYDEVVAASACPVVLGENVTLVGYELGPKVVTEVINQHTEIVGLSYTVPLAGLAGLADIIGRLGERVAIRVGLLHHLINVAALGGAGILCFDGNLVPGLVSEVWRAALDGRADVLDKLHLLVLVNAELTRFGNPASIKAALDHLGRRGGGLRRPFLGLDDEERRQLASGLDRLVDDPRFAGWL